MKKTVSNDRQARLREARLAYAQRLRGQSSQVLELADALPAAREQLREAAHRIHGTAGSYGFAQVSEAAARLERVLVAQPESQEVHELAEVLANALSHATAPPRG